ncbi:unnamed protein product [Mytilus edulis]|uniref:Uncharacterized protein n=1 Tax=Mytilus edulis TaxID=6550 RepID=A0A8S3RKB4_MYTED|nr:unnamed protein product [Mytilus edulis]
MTAGYDLKCPARAEWKLRGNISCSAEDRYVCLFHLLDQKYMENCLGSDRSSIGKTVTTLGLKEQSVNSKGATAVEEKPNLARTMDLISVKINTIAVRQVPSKNIRRKFQSTPVSNSDTFSEISIDAPAKFLSSRDAHKMVKEQMRRDQEKESALFSLRRRMATASGRKP